jgi:DNA-3-methyladenine glycosylase
VNSEAAVKRNAQERILNRDDLPEDTAALARFLIGKLVVRAFPDATAVARIVETEAYLAGDAASHSFRGKTRRNKVMFGPPGYAYVYLAYGVSYMLNVSSAEEGAGEAVLIRAAEPLAGLEAMRRLRADAPARDLLRGPGRLAKALDIDRRLDGVDLCSAGELWLASDVAQCGEIGVSVRIGITRDADRPLRFYLKESRYLSGPGALNGVPQRRALRPPSATT